MRAFSILAAVAASFSTFVIAIGSQNSGQSNGLSTVFPTINSIWTQACLGPLESSSCESDANVFSANADDKSDIIMDPVNRGREIADDQTIFTSLATDERLIDPEICSLMEKYKGRFICCSVAKYPDCDILLCGTLHVATTSADMVQDAIKVLKPEYIVLELCEARVDNLCDEDVRNVTLSDVIKESYKLRSVKVFGMGLLTWMQLKTARALGSKLGGEQTVAAKVGIEQGSTVILGDRLYAVTFQRVFDRLQLFEKLKFAVVLLWEVMTMSFLKLKDYIRKSEDQEGFIQDEIARFGKHLPAFAKVLIEERDEYLSQTIFEIARVVGQGYGQSQSTHTRRRTRVMAVVGAGHLAGIQRCLAAGGVSEERIIEISSSSKHPHPGTWLGRGMLQVVNPNIFQPQQQAEANPAVEQTQQVQQQIESKQGVPSPVITDSTSTSTSTSASHDVVAVDIVNTAIVDNKSNSEVVTDLTESLAPINVLDDVTTSGCQTVVEENVMTDEVMTSGVQTVVEENVMTDELMTSGVQTVVEENVMTDEVMTLGVQTVVEENVMTDEVMTSGVQTALGIDQTEEQVDVVVQLLSSLTPIVESAHAAVELAKTAALTAGLELPNDLITHLSLLGEAVTDAKKAFLLADEADKRSAAPEEMERELNGLTNAIVRATVAANAVVESAQTFSSDSAK